MYWRACSETTYEDENCNSVHGNQYLHDKVTSGKASEKISFGRSLKSRNVIS